MRRLTFVATLALSLFSDAAFAQPIAGHGSSVEWLAASSDRLVRGVIQAVKVNQLKGGFHHYDGVNRYQTVTVRVLETLKGEAPKQLPFVETGDLGVLFPK